jgi:hypothetical protein
MRRASTDLPPRHRSSSSAGIGPFWMERRGPATGAAGNVIAEGAWSPTPHAAMPAGINPARSPLPQEREPTEPATHQGGPVSP